MISERPYARIRFASLCWLAFVFPNAAPVLSEDLPDVSARPPWTLITQTDDLQSGYVLYQRNTIDSDAATYRLEAIVDSAPDLVALAVASYIVDPAYSQANTDKTILRNDEDVIVVYSYIHIDAPFVSDRDVISRIERSHDPATKVYRLAWRVIDEGGPAKKDGVIRLERSDGSWTFSPNDDGTTRAVYESHTEIAGFLPTWLVNAQMTQTMLEGIEGLRKAVDRQRQGESALDTPDMREGQ